MIRRSTVVSTPPTERVLTLAEAKAHLRVDDLTPGVKASIVKGSGDSALKLTAKVEGSYANSWTLTLVASGLNTALSVALNGNDFTVTLATDGAGVATSTANDAIAALLNNTIIASKISASANTGSGTGVLASATITNFSGGVDGVSPHDDYITGLILAVEGQTQTILRRSLMPQTLELRLDEFPSSPEIELDFGPVTAVNSIEYLDGNGDSQEFGVENYSVDLNSTPPVISVEPNIFWPCTEISRRNAVTIEYEAGYADAASVPAEIKAAMKLFIGHLFTNRESIQVGPGITTLEIPQAAMWLLWPYRDLRF